MAVSKFFASMICLWVSLAVAGQNNESEKISIAFTNEPLPAALMKLDQNTVQQLSFNPQSLPPDATVTNSFQSESPESIIQTLLGSAYQVKNIGNYLIIQKAPVSKKEKSTFEIKGGVRDAKTGEELEDVSIYEINTLKSTLSDQKGAFDLKTESEFEAATFIISKRFYLDTVIHITRKENLSSPIVLQKEEEEAKTGLMIRERVRTFSSGLAKFFTSIEIRQNAENVNFVDTRLFQASLVPSIGTNRKLSSQIRNRISLNLLAGYSYGVRGVEVGGFYNIDREEVRGVQVGGFGNTVGGEVHGVQVGGFINTSKDYVNGVQIGGFFNLASDSVNGFQAAGFTNITRDMEGFQVAGFNNHTKKVSGFQLSGFINTTNEMEGMQLTGFINIAKKVKGLQLSVINIADTVESGVPFGIINIVKKNGFISPAVESNDVIPYGFAFRTGLDKFYTILSAGINPDQYWSLGAGLGSRLFTSPERKLFLNPELRWSSLAENKIKENEDSNLFSLNLNVGYQLFNRLSITSGPTLNFYFTNHLDEGGDPMLTLAENTLVDDDAFGNRYQLWVGYSVGIGF